MRKIGIPGWKTGENSFGATVPYLQFISSLGGYPVILSPEHDIVDLDLLILPGGMDINPSYYGQAPGFMTSNTDVFKQSFFERHVPEYIKNKTPIFGICLGFQQLCVKYGCEFSQHFVTTYSTKSREEAVEELNLNIEFLKSISDNNLIWDKKTKGYTVNSLHHQAVLTTSSAFNTVALSRLYGNVEAVIHKTLPIAGVQWHPEELNNSFGDLVTHTLITNLLK